MELTWKLWIYANMSHRFIEALKDHKSWLFFLHSWSQEMANGITNQYSLIIKSFGFSVAQTTLLGMVSGATAFVSLAAAAVVLAKTKVFFMCLYSSSFLSLKTRHRIGEPGYLFLHISLVLFRVLS